MTPFILVIAVMNAIAAIVVWKSTYDNIRNEENLQNNTENIHRTVTEDDS